MGMTIEDARTALGKERKYALHENKQAFDIAIDTMCKYQKIKEILKDDTYYEEYGNNAEKFIVSAICEVLKNGNDD